MSERGVGCVERGINRVLLEAARAIAERVQFLGAPPAGVGVGGPVAMGFSEEMWSVGELQPTLGGSGCASSARRGGESTRCGGLCRASWVLLIRRAWSRCALSHGRA